MMSFHFSYPVLFSVHRGLDSHHPQEQEAAITAAVALCQYSRFANVLYYTIAAFELILLLVYLT